MGPHATTLVSSVRTSSSISKAGVTTDEHYALVSDTDLQVNAQFIGLRPVGGSRDFTWIQALGLLFGSHTFTLEATRAETWSDEIDCLRFSYDGTSITLPETHDFE